MLDFFIEILKGIASVFIYGWWLFAIVLGFLAFQNKRKTKWVTSKENVVLEVKIPKTNDKNPTAAEMMFATLHGILKPKSEIIKEGSMQEHISFEIASDMTSIRFYVWTPKHLKDFVEGQIYAQYPTAEITETEDYTKRVTEEQLKEDQKYISCAELVLDRSDFIPIKTFNNFTVDPLAGITGVLSKVEEENEEIWIQMLMRPVSDEWKQKGLNWAAKKKGGKTTFDFSTEGILTFPFKLVVELFKMAAFGPQEAKDGKSSVSSEDEGRISAVQLKAEKLGFEVKIRILYSANDKSKASEKMHAIFGAFKQYNSTNLNGFKGRNIHNKQEFLRDYQNRIFLSGGYHLNIEELASIYHLPHTSVETPNIKWTTFKTGEPPTELPNIKNTPENDITLFAETNFRANRGVFGIKRDDRRRHMYIIGKSGMGKTKLLENLANHDIQKGEGVAIMDPHGDYISDILKKIPEERAKDVIIFDPADTNFPIAFNPMEVMDEHMKVQIAAGVVGTFKKIFGFSWGPRLEYVLNYTVLALLDTEGTTLIGIVNMLTDKNYRKMIVANIKDPVVKKFWTTEFASYSEKFATEAIAPILNKVGQFVANSLIRNVIGQPKSSFNIRRAMDEGKILLINLSTGRVGETNAALLGSLMITAIQLAAMSRADIPEEERKDFYLYVDEFQNFATESFATILSEARKYRLNLIMANQYIQQMDDVVREAVFGNVGTMITFRVGAGDASVLEKEFNPPFVSQDLINLPRQHIYIRMTIDGQSESAFSAKTLTVTTETTGLSEEILNWSRKNYTKSKEEVEADVAKGAGIKMDEPTSTQVSEVIKEEVEAAEEAIKDGENIADFEFEAPIVKKINHHKHDKRKPVDKDALKAVIRENTKSEEGPEGETKEPAMLVKDKIDKETLSAILESVVKPSENNINKEINKPTENKIVENRGVEEKKKPEADNKINKTSDSPTHQKRERVITPDNFKEVKQIHPHEQVKIVSDKPKDLREGEEIKFD